MFPRAINLIMMTKARHLRTQLSHFHLQVTRALSLRVPAVCTIAVHIQHLRYLQHWHRHTVSLLALLLIQRNISIRVFPKVDGLKAAGPRT